MWLGLSECRFCDCDIDKNSIHAEEYLTPAVMDWPQPENVKDIRDFLGLTSYDRIVIEQYASVEMRLYDTGTPPKGKGDFGRRCGELWDVKHTPFACDTECHHAFDTLQNALCTSPHLALIDPEAKYCLPIDASQYALGAELSQVQNMAEKVPG
jgi:hypothetical protein